MKNSKPRTDLVGQRFGKLVVASWAGRSRWICKCDCGKTSAPVLTANLTRGNTASCGCVRNILSSKRATKHGLYFTPAYRSWASIKKRCTKPNDPMYPSYGGAGIRLYSEWLNDPVAFCEYIGQPESDDMSIDRIDGTKGYEPGNIRWATSTEQARNRGVCVAIEFQGQKFRAISEFVEWLEPQIKVNPISLTAELQKRLRRKRTKQN
jgi:hypothetical protein